MQTLLEHSLCIGEDTPDGRHLERYAREVRRDRRYVCPVSGKNGYIQRLESHAVHALGLAQEMSTLGYG